MAQGGRARVPRDLGSARRRIEGWRRTRSKRGPMPGPLWAEAVALASRHGPWRVSRTLGIDYSSLKARMASADHSASASAGSQGVTFVELAATGSAPAEGAMATVVELSAADGSKLLIRAPSGEGVDVLGLAEAFWRRRA